MSRYIDADKLRKDEIARCRCVPLVGSNENNYKDLDEVLADAPTADVVEVVRCKDCTWWYDRYIDPLVGYHYGRCERPLGEYYECDCDFSTTSNDYCSYGERRTEND